MSRLLRMPYINNITISGNLTRDVDTKYSAKNVAIANLTIAVNHFYKDDKGEFQEQVSFIDAVAFGDTAQKCIKDLKKGSPVIIEGYLKTRSYVDQNSINRKVTEININKVYPLERLENPNPYPQSQYQQNNQYPPQNNQYPPQNNQYQQNQNQAYPPPPRPPQSMPPDEPYVDPYRDAPPTVDDTTDVPF